MIPRGKQVTNDGDAPPVRPTSGRGQDLYSPLALAGGMLLILSLVVQSWVVTITLLSGPAGDGNAAILDSSGSPSVPEAAQLRALVQRQQFELRQESVLSGVGVATGLTLLALAGLLILIRAAGQRTPETAPRSWQDAVSGTEVSAFVLLVVGVVLLSRTVPQEAQTQLFKTTDAITAKYLLPDNEPPPSDDRPEDTGSDSTE